VAGVCFAEFTDWQNIKKCPVFVQSRCEHHALFFPALVSNCSFLHGGRSFRMIPGFKTLSFSGFWSRPRLRVVGSCIRSVVVILPVGSITPVGIRNFYIPGNPDTPDWPSALRLCASSGFGPVNSSVTRFVFPAVCRASAIVGILHSIALRFLFATFLHYEYHRELTATRVTTFLLFRFCNLVFSSFRFPA